jgi:hypothetical protein
MGKNNRLTDGAFSVLIGNDEQVKFLLADDELGIKVTPEIAQYKELYTRILNKNIGDITLLAKLEETITQMRCKEVAKKDFKLSQVRGYIYARTPFFRNGKDIKDIRVVVGKTSDYGDDLTALFANKAFVIQAKEKLQVAMTNEIKQNMIYINELEEKIFSV